MNKVLAFLRAIKLFDADNTLSLSSVLVWIVAIHLAADQVLGAGFIVALALSLVSYNGKKWFAKLHADKTMADSKVLSELSVTVENLKGDVKRLESSQSLKNLGR